MFKTIASIACLSFCLAGCQTGNLLTGQNAGALGGAALGGFVGNKFGAGKGRVLTTAGGTILGGAAGSILGGRLDQRDVSSAQQAQTTALQQQAGQPISWTNPNTGTAGQVVSGASYAINGRECRDYTHTLNVNNQPEQLRGVACRQPDGSWQAVS
ncbi:MAG: RT0821/Lpp0805 family surface protein [Hyphomicrobiales bacterium]